MNRFIGFLIWCVGVFIVLFGYHYMFVITAVDMYEGIGVWWWNIIKLLFALPVMLLGSIYFIKLGIARMQANKNTPRNRHDDYWFGPGR